MSYKLNIDRAELNRDNISEILQSKGVEEDRIKEFIAVLDTCEYARYAPGSNSDQEMGKASNYTLCLNSSQLGYNRCEKIIMECSCNP